LKLSVEFADKVVNAFEVVFLFLHHGLFTTSPLPCIRWLALRLPCNTYGAAIQGGR
jgi:hypothetical protein